MAAHFPQGRQPKFPIRCIGTWSDQVFDEPWYINISPSILCTIYCPWYWYDIKKITASFVHQPFFDDESNMAHWHVSLPILFINHSDGPWYYKRLFHCLFWASSTLPMVHKRLFHNHSLFCASITRWGAMVHTYIYNINYYTHLL